MSCAASADGLVHRTILLDLPHGKRIPKDHTLRWHTRDDVIYGCFKNDTDTEFYLTRWTWVTHCGRIIVEWDSTWNRAWWPAVTCLACAASAAGEGHFDIEVVCTST